MADRLAVPLCWDKNLVRFRSLVNRRIFSLVLSDGLFELVELDGNTERPDIVRFIYFGGCAEEVKAVILKEVCDV